jgi:hypothetical protein
VAALLSTAVRKDGMFEAGDQLDLARKAFRKFRRGISVGE